VLGVGKAARVHGVFMEDLLGMRAQCIVDVVQVRE